MINTVKAGTGAPYASMDRRSKRDPNTPSTPHEQEEAPVVRPPRPPEPDADLRLVIERDADGADYMYRLVDRKTGKVVSELPRNEVNDLANAPSYAAGALVSTKA
jgi:hypothetical protein